MRLALEQAQEAYDNGEVPIGAIIVCNDNIVAVARNEREESNQTIAHAEVLAIQKANEKLGSWRLDSCTMYVTIEPCPMCAGSIIQSRLKEVYYGATDQKAGSHKSITNLFDQPYNHQVNVIGGILEKECREIMTSFFQKLREK
jgi:tRNA(adenine34) deaminase